MCVQLAESAALFGRPIDRDAEISLLKSGLRDVCFRAVGCIGWVWRQWLLCASREEISSRVEPLVERGLELRERCKSYEGLPLHDLFLLNCAIFGSSEGQLKKVVERVADTSGDKGEKPYDNGELFAAAWCGMMKYWILGDDEKAMEQSNFIWGAYREEGVTTATKPLVTPWLKRDSKGFAKAQQRDFDKWWSRVRKAGRVIRSENEREIVVTSYRFDIASYWCWSHCGLALLAHRQGSEVATDPFWFPPHALKIVPEP